MAGRLCWGRFAPGVVVLAGRFALCSRLALRLCCCVLPSVHVRRCGSVGAFVLGSRLLFAAWRQTGRLAVSCVPIPPGRDRHSRVLDVSARLSALVGSLRAWTFLCGDLDGVVGDAGDEETELRGWRRGACTSLRGRIGSVSLSAGSTLGLRAPDCAKESSTLWTLFTLRRGYAGSNTYPCKKRQRPNQRTHACKARVHGKTRPALIYGRAGRAV